MIPQPTDWSDMEGLRSYYTQLQSGLSDFTQTAPEFQAIQGYYQNNPMSQALQAQLMGRTTGQLQPYSDQMISSEIGGQVGSLARNFSMQSDMARQHAANAGMSGGGQEYSAISQARNRASSLARQARSQITSSRQLANYQDAVQAGQQIKEFMGQQMQALQFQASQAASMQQQATQNQSQFTQGIRDVSQDGGGSSGSGGLNSNQRSLMATATGMGRSPLYAHEGIAGGSEASSHNIRLDAQRQAQQSYARNQLAAQGISVV